MPENINILLRDYISQIRGIFGSHLLSVTLFGSYARGDFREDSDQDICILLDEDDLGVKKYMERLAAITFDFNMDHDTEINPIMISEHTFLKWHKVYPFYQNIEREGVRLYAA